MTEGLYSYSGLAIAGILLASAFGAVETGYRLGLLALLLGFTFSLSLERFNRRSDTVVEEANAIGTAYLAGTGSAGDDAGRHPARAA